MAIVQANDKEFLSLLRQNNTAYIIPKYQRDYSWDGENLEDFWDDIYRGAYSQNTGLFLGSLIFTASSEVAHSAPGVRYFDVIDGQQRLTTILILLRALYDVVEPEHADRVNQLIKDRYFFAAPNSQEYRLRVGGENEQFFKDYVLNPEYLGAPVGVSRASQKRIIRALSYFRDQIRKAAEGMETIQFVEDFLDSIAHNLTIVHITAESDVDAYTVFETINSKKKDLTPSDLLKNYFLSVTSPSPARLRGVQAAWEEINKQLEEKDLDITEFIRHYWISANEGKVSEKKLYRVVSASLGRDSEKVISLITTLKKEVSYYVDIAAPPEVPNRNSRALYFQNLKELGNRQCYPLILALCARENLVEDREIIDILKGIIYISLRRGVCDRNPNELENLYSNHAYRIRVGDRVAVEEFRRELAAFDVDDEEFLQAARAGQMSPKLIKFILLRLEDAVSERAQRLVAKDLQIEHIMPENPENLDDWHVDKETHKNFLENIGNKTLISGPKNQEMSNKKYSEKCRIYSESDLRITRALPEEFSEWSTAAIEKRAGRIADKLAEIFGFKLRS